MKRIISTFISAIIGITALSSIQAGAVEKTETSGKKNIVVLGDSIASGYTRKGNVAHNYGEICGDYLDLNVYNYAVPGDTTEQLLAKLSSFSAAENKTLSDAEYVVISIGGNDMIGYISKYMLGYASRKNLFNEGYSAKDIPEKPSFSDITKMINIYGEGGLKETLESSVTAALAFGTEMSELTTEIAGTLDLDTEIYSGGYIEEHIVPNIQKAVDSIKKINPDTKVYVQTIFQPVQFDETFLSNKSASRKQMINILRYDLEGLMQSYSDQLANVKNIEIVDVKQQFTAIAAEPTANNPGHTSYFVDIQADSISDMDIHPNQRGHVAIAAAILDKIGKLHADSGLLSQTFDSLSGKDSYPDIPLATYRKVSGNPNAPAAAAKLGDINSDGYVDAVDASGVLKEYARVSVGKGTFTDAQKKAADVDKNGILDSVDASKILKYYAYLSNSQSDKKTLEEFLKSA